MIICTNVEIIVAPQIVQHPRPGNDSMGFQEFYRCVGMHLGRNHAQQVVFQPYTVYRPYLIALYNKTKSSGKAPGNLFLPVESYSDGHVVEDEGGFAEQGGPGHSLEGKLIIEHAVIINATVHPAHPLLPCSIGNNLKNYLFGGHDANVNLGLGAREPPYHKRIVFGTYGDLLHHFPELFLRDAVEIFFARGNEKTSHVSRTGAHGKVLFPFGKIMMGTKGGTEHDCSAELPVFIPGKQVEARLILSFAAGRALEQTVKKLRHRLLRGSLQDIHSPCETFELVKAGILYPLQFHAGTVKRRICSQFQRKDSPWARLEMKMVGGGCPAHGAVVEHREVLVHLRKQQHVREVMPDGLGDMLVAHHYEMIPKDRVGINLDIVASVLLTFVFQMKLFFRTVLDTEETGTRCY